MSNNESPSEAVNKARICNADAFLDEFERHTTHMDNKRFCFIIGAGASKTSGISLGGELAVEWLKELHFQEAPNGQSFEEWATADNLKIPEFSLNRVADFYTNIFERRFEGRMDDGQFWLEKKFGNALPSTGYYFLAQILGNSKHKVVITTNFDNLVADAVLQLTGNLPRIISDARIARFLSPQPRLPIIAKVHGDIGFATTINTTHGIEQLDEEWKTPLRRILELYVPIVIGWEGNDGSLMDFLTKEMLDDQGRSLLPSGIFWCYRNVKSWQERLEQNPKLTSLAKAHTIRFIPIDGFDEWMLRLARTLSKDNPLQTLQTQQKKRMNVFEGNLTVELEQIEKSLEANPNLTPKQKKDITSLNEMLLVHNAQKEIDIIKRIDKLKDLLATYPESLLIHQSLAMDFHNIHKSKEAAIHYIKAIELNPQSAPNLGNYATLLHSEFNDLKQSAHYYQKALEADPKNPNNLCNYASFLDHKCKNYDSAEEYYQKAIETDPENTNYLGNYAQFLIGRQRFLEAIPYVDKAWAKFLLWNTMGVGEVIFSRWLLACVLKKDSFNALGRIKTLLQIGFDRSPWSFDNMLDSCLPKLTNEQGELSVKLAAAILDETKIKDLNADQNWTSVQAIPINTPWPDKLEK
jgi:tetratricopeptide (TPR) repeat protein